MLNGIEIKKVLGLCAENVFTLGLLPAGRKLLRLVFSYVLGLRMRGQNDSELRNCNYL